MMDRRRDRVRVGCYVDPVAPTSVVRANIALSRALGADDIWLGDHTRAMLPALVWDPKRNPMARLIPNLDAYYDPCALIARYAKRGLTIGTAVTDALRRSPADMARAWMTLHHLTKGNAILGIGAGEVENTVPYGIPYEKPVARLEDMLAGLRAAWSSDGQPVSHHGPFHDWNDASFAIPQLKGTSPPVWVAAQGPRASRAAGTYGDGWMHVHYGIDEWQASARNVIIGARAAGRDEQRLTRTLLIAGIVVSSRQVLARAVRSPVLVAAALALPASGWERGGAQHPLGTDYRGPQDYQPHLVTPDVMRRATAMMTPQLFESLMPAGSAAHVRRYLQPFVEQGVSHVVLINLAPAAGIAIGADSLREQRRLMSALKAMTPGRFQVSSDAVTTDAPAVGSAAPEHR
jgi:phthiodiolone/phenolphthiodiolone dimycocerosates ketoreductase